MPIGKRPVPRVATGAKGSINTSSGKYAGKRGSKSPIGSRPVPPVAKDSHGGPPPMNAVKPAVKHTSMPSPNKTQTTGKDKAVGGGSKGGY